MSYYAERIQFLLERLDEARGVLFGGTLRHTEELPVLMRRGQVTAPAGRVVVASGFEDDDFDVFVSTSSAGYILTATKGGSGDITIAVRLHDGTTPGTPIHISWLAIGSAQVD